MRQIIFVSVNAAFLGNCVISLEQMNPICLKKKYSDQLSTTALVKRNATKNLENSCLILNQLY